MKILLRVLAGICAIISVVLIALVINALSSQEGAETTGVVAYLAAALFLAFLALRMWISTLGDRTASPPPPPA